MNHKKFMDIERIKKNIMTGFERIKNEWRNPIGFRLWAIDFV